MLPNNGSIQLEQIRSITGGGKTVEKQQIDSKGPSFGEVLKGQTAKGPQQVQEALAQKVEALKFSNHAVDRMRSRGISMGPERLQKMAEAVDKAAKKGAKETLLMTDDSAFIVSVKNRTVITALDKATMKENVFTNIDSTVLI